MLKNDVVLGEAYVARISGRRTVIRIEAEATPLRGWYARNLQTNREVRIRSAAKLQRSVPEDKVQTLLNVLK